MKPVKKALPVWAGIQTPGIDQELTTVYGSRKDGNRNTTLAVKIAPPGSGFFGEQKTWQAMILTDL